MAKIYRIFENGREVTTARSAVGWKRTVKGLNASMECVDCDYQDIKVKLNGKIVFHQRHEHVP